MDFVSTFSGVSAPAQVVSILIPFFQMGAILVLARANRQVAAYHVLRMLTKTTSITLTYDFPIANCAQWTLTLVSFPSTFSISNVLHPQSKMAFPTTSTGSSAQGLVARINSTLTWAVTANSEFGSNFFK